MKNPHYKYKEAKEELLRVAAEILYAKESLDLAIEEFAALIEEIRDNETEESFQNILLKFHLDRERVDAMIAEYQEEVNNG
jgi:hypothetical protein